MYKALGILRARGRRREGEKKRLHCVLPKGGKGVYTRVHAAQDNSI